MPWIGDGSAIHPHDRRLPKTSYDQRGSNPSPGVRRRRHPQRFTAADLRTGLPGGHEAVALNRCAVTLLLPSPSERVLVVTYSDWLWARGWVDQLGETDRPAGRAMMVVRRLCEAVGLLLEEMFCYPKGLDRGLWAKNTRFKVLNVPASRVCHKVTPPTGGVATPISKYYSIRNTLLCLVLNAPLPLPLRMLRYGTAITPITVGALKQRGPKLTRLRAVAKGVLHYFQNRYGLCP